MNQKPINANIEAAKAALARRLDNERHLLHEMWRLENAEQITGQAAFVKGLEAATLIFNTIKRVQEQETAVDTVTERQAVEAGIRRMMAEFDAAYIDITIGNNDAVALAISDEFDEEVEVVGSTLEDVFTEAVYLKSFMKQAF